MQSDRPPMRSEQFGPLQGVRIVSSGTILAQPFAAGMAAEMGAEVIHIERPKLGDVWRSVEFGMPTEGGGAIAAGWMQTQRNTYDITLDLSTHSRQGNFPSVGLASRYMDGKLHPRHLQGVGPWMTKRSIKSIPSWSSPTYPATARQAIPIIWPAPLTT